LLLVLLLSPSTGLDCVLAQGHSSTKLPVRKILVSVLMPIGAMLFLVAMEVAFAFVRRLLHNRRRQQRRLTTQTAVVLRKLLPAGTLAQTAIVLAFFFLPSLLRTAYGLFACTKLDVPTPTDGTFFQFNAVGRFWLLDTNQQCFEGYHYVWALALGIPLLTLLLTVPVGVVVFLWLHRDKLEETYFLQHFGFFVHVVQAQQVLVGRCFGSAG
jgi:hypothetical protein